MNFFSNPFILEDFGRELPLPPPKKSDDDDTPKLGSLLSLVELRVQVNQTTETTDR